MKTQQKEANRFFFNAMFITLFVAGVIAIVALGNSVAHAEEYQTAQGSNLVANSVDPAEEYQIVQEIRGDHVVAEIRTKPMSSLGSITYDNHPELRPKPREAVGPDGKVYQPK